LQPTLDVGEAPRPLSTISGKGVGGQPGCSGVVDVLSDLVIETQRRALSLLDFLEAFYRRRFPPVRDTAKFGDFLLREPDLPTVRA